MKNRTPSGPALLVDLTMQAAEAGQGFALADDIVAADSLLAGRLVSPFATKIETYSYYLVRGTDRPMSKAATAFTRWLKGEIARTTTSLRTMRDAQHDRNSLVPRRRTTSTRT